LPGMQQWLTYPELRETNGWNFIYEALVQASQSWNVVIIDLGTATSQPHTSPTQTDFGIACALHAGVMRHVMRIVNVFGSLEMFEVWWRAWGARRVAAAHNVHVMNYTQPPKKWEMWKAWPMELPDAVEALTLGLPRANSSLLDMPSPVPQREIATAFNRLAQVTASPLTNPAD
jgi:hypothetical protein